MPRALPRRTAALPLLLLLLLSAASPAAGFIGRLVPSVREAAKEALLESIRQGEAEATVLRRFEALESGNPTPNALSSPLLSGDWRLVWTTSASIAGATRPAALQPAVAPLQRIDAVNLRARNAEVIRPFGLLSLESSVEAELTPKSKFGVDVQFKRFNVGPIGFAAPESARGALDVTFLDGNLRLSRGDKGNLFVLLRDGAEGSEEADALWKATLRTFREAAGRE